MNNYVAGSLSTVNSQLWTVDCGLFYQSGLPLSFDFVALRLFCCRY